MIGSTTSKDAWNSKPIGKDGYRNYVIGALLFLLMFNSIADAAVDLSQFDGKRLFQSLLASKCTVNCVTGKIRPVCGTDNMTYASRCELKQARRCEKKKVKVMHKGRCPGDIGHLSKCLREREEALEISRRQTTEVVLPTCKADGSYNDIQCHRSTGYCWCVTQDGRHIPKTSVKDRQPKCKGKKRKRKVRGGKSKKRKTCSSKDRQTFNGELIKVFKEEYDRANITPPPAGPDADEFGTEKAIVEWKFIELDTNKDGTLRFKEIRTFGRMVKKLIKPKNCARRFLDFCDKKRDRSIDKAEWTLCLGVDIKPDGNSPDTSPLGSTRDGLLVVPDTLPVGPDVPNLISSRPSPSAPTNQVQERNTDQPQSCTEEREAAIKFHSQEPDAKHFIPICTDDGTWEKAQCHQTGYCWCVKETTGLPIPGTATYRVTPNCTFDNEREIKGCPFEQKRRFLVTLVADLTKEMKDAEEKEGKKPENEFEGNISLRETVARWKLKSLDKNNNGMLDKKEWRPLRKKTLKSKKYPRRCRRSFLRYCDADSNKKITAEEWKDCLGLNHNYFNSLPLNPKRKGKNPFVDQLT